jgi:hypothetical protein
VLVTARWCSRYTDSGRCERLVRATKWACGSDFPQRAGTDGRCCMTSGALAPTNCSLPSSALGWDLGKVPQTRKQQRRSCSSESQNAGPNGSRRLTSRYVVRVPGKKKGTLTETPLGHHLSLCPLSSLRVRSWSGPRPQTDTDRLRKHIRAAMRQLGPLSRPQTILRPRARRDLCMIPHLPKRALLYFYSRQSRQVIRRRQHHHHASLARSLARTRQWKSWAKGARTLPSSLGWAEKQLAMTSCSAWATAPPV